ncbi:NUDIX hydrolase [Nonlabens ponticola]|uniref:NUDIX domain-containing protein n=1 Tax=Nonlabens ponticola TaxID=2496866 RepID=A0A3S9N0F7_9FLAO|nr:NUDIX domain-containing protein [Nonlabens ponticola]AZQ45026.1 NUDIX domain-containing protein [Nonlabens ponticola]
MYKVFVKEVAIIVTSDKNSFPEYEHFNLKRVNLRKVVKRIEKGKLGKVLLYSKNEEKLLKRLHKKLPLVLAGGGMVLNSDEKYLFIYRNNKWDLPKGKAEKNESIEQTALREVEEETGVKNLEISKYLDKTYHIFSRNGKMSLKLTHWYEMRTDYKGKLKPQAKEGIEIASWLTDEEVTNALTESYANIRELFPLSMISS